MLRIVVRSFEALLLSMVLMLSGCYYDGILRCPVIGCSEEQSDSNLLQSFSPSYTLDYNFVVTSDSMLLLDGIAGSVEGDTVVFYRGDRAVVADIQTVVSDSVDSVWVKLARDYSSQGWCHESYMLTCVSPDDPISLFIDMFSDVFMSVHVQCLALAVGIYVLWILFRRRAVMVHFRDIDSPFPMLLALLVAVSAVVYASVQVYYPDVWRHYYFNPSLNPFALPPCLSLLISLLWAIVIVLLASLDDIFHKLSFADGLVYVGGLAAMCVLNYVVFSVLTHYIIGYPLLAVYVFFAVRQYLRRGLKRYVCGNCGSRISRKGRCPECGAYNE